MSSRALVLFHNNRTMLEQLDDAERGRLLMACLDYSEHGTLPELDGLAKGYFPLLRDQIDFSKALHEEKCKRLTANARKRWGKEQVAVEGTLSITPDGVKLDAQVCQDTTDTDASLPMQMHAIACKSMQDRIGLDRIGEDKTGKDKTRTVKPPRAAAREATAAEFERFWAVYPRKAGKHSAKKAWVKAVAQAPPETIIAAVEVAKAKDRRFADSQFTPHPATWLNSGGWNDEYPDNAIKNKCGPSPPSNWRAAKQSSEYPEQITIKKL